MLVAYGFRYEDVEQNLKEDIKIYPTGIFGYSCSTNPNYSVCYHNSLNSWTEKTPEEARRLWLERYYLLKPYDWYKKQKRRVKRFIKKGYE
ncbi:MAG: hypothetical protein MJZ20_04885 [Bacteroidaceae bacterium]|nr:hypothetical protein [Bacteroidaceae bacterium]